jgi:ubiquinone/menaquinone biosynthesis C-methylase UbiE
MTTPEKRPSQCRKPSGWIGRLTLWSMNRRHSGLTDWGLEHLRIDPSDSVLDVGCGGGRTVGKLAALARNGNVVGVDYAEASVEASRRENAMWIERGRVEIRHASVSALPFPDDTFDLITAVETHFWWPDLAHDVREVRRVLKPGGRLAVIAEFYDGGKHAKYAERLSKVIGIASLTLDQHRDMLATADFADVQIIEDERRGWICVLGTKPGGKTAVESERPTHVT